MKPRRQPLWMAPAGLAAALLLFGLGWIVYEIYEGRGLREARELVALSRQAPSLRDSASFAERARRSAPRAEFPYEEIIRVHRAWLKDNPGSYREIEMAAHELIVLNQRNAFAHAQLGLVAAQWRHDHAKAFQHYRRALALEPGNESLYPALAAAAQAMGRPQEALPVLAAGSRALPQSKVVRELRARLEGSNL